MRRLLLVLVISLSGCFKDEEKVCPTLDDHGKQECLDYGAAYIETREKIYCHTPSGLIMQRRK